MPVLKVVIEKPANQEQIFFDAWITLKNDQAEEVRYLIVGLDEISVKNYISMDAPLARILLKTNIDDGVKIKTEFGERWYLILDINVLKCFACATGFSNGKISSLYSLKLKQSFLKSPHPCPAGEEINVICLI